MWFQRDKQYVGVVCGIGFILIGRVGDGFFGLVFFDGFDIVFFDDFGVGGELV